MGTGLSSGPAVRKAGRAGRVSAIAVLLLLLGVDHFLDMARSATNVIGNSVATAVVSKWEGQLVEESEVPAAIGQAADGKVPT